MGRQLAVIVAASTLLGVGVLGPSAASATTPTFFSRAVAWDFREPICDTGQSSAPTASCSQTNVTIAPFIRIEGDASSNVAFATGVLDASANSSGAYSTGQFGQAEAVSTLFDTLTFQGPFAPTDTVTVTMSATVTLSPAFSGGPPGDVGGSDSGFISLEGDDIFGHDIAMASDCSPNSDTRFCFPVTFGNAVITNVGNLYSITETFNLAQNPTLGLRFGVGVETIGDASGSVIDPITITLPPGVTYTSASGLFLTGGGVPEPATWLSLTAGLWTLGLMLRRRRTYCLSLATSAACSCAGRAPKRPVT